MVVGHIDAARQTTCLQILAAVTGQTDFRTQQSEDATVEQDGVMQFYVSLFSISTGAIPLADIDITGMTAVMARSRAGGAFNPAGITQPTFAKANGSVSAAYQFLLAEWQTGDIYRLVLAGVKATVGGDVVFLPDMVWSNLVVESATIQTTVNTINTVQGPENAAATLDNLTDVTTTSTEAKLRRILLRLAPGAFTATIQGATPTDLAAMIGTLVTYFSTGGGLFAQTINPGGAVRNNIELCFRDLSDILAGAGITTYPASAVPGNGVSIAQVVSKVYDLVTATAIEADVNTSLNTIVPATPTVGALTDILSKAAPGNTFNKATDSLEAIADTMALDSTVAKDATVAKADGVGTVFSVVKSVLQSTIVAAGIDLTLVSSGGALELIGAYIQNGGTAFASGTGTAVAEIYTDNVRGSASFFTMTIAGGLLGLANCIVSDKNATSWTGVVLETGKKVSIKATTEDFTSAGTADIYLIFRRLAAGATVVAA
jgi:hypothetical protein